MALPAFLLFRYCLYSYATTISVLTQMPTIVVDYGDFSLSKGREKCSSTTGEVQNESLIHLNGSIISDFDSDIFLSNSRFKFQDFYGCEVIIPSYRLRREETNGINERWVASRDIRNSRIIRKCRHKTYQ